MRTHTKMLLLMLFAISSCGRTGGGASEVTAADQSTQQEQPSIRVAEATTQGPTSPPSTGVVRDGKYNVCKVESDKNAKEGGSKKYTGLHFALRLNDEIEIMRALPNDPLGQLIFSPQGKREP